MGGWEGGGGVITKCYYGVGYGNSSVDSCFSILLFGQFCDPLDFNQWHIFCMGKLALLDLVLTLPLCSMCISFEVTGNHLPQVLDYWK